ncbi:hypothetical protein KEG38_00730 [Polyangium jinanense]|uniref:hypothetical protein n=1 Tax=Polyangium jinanense TaxID=2829994 RepID=UPI002341BE22|nr:hypothetical protein [Polyangium jinanense]MDC3952351.1 hypothetical protein [Polyangium jinanense]
MRMLVVGLFFVWFVVLAPACWEPACKNPKKGAPNAEAGAREGVLVQCNVVLTCALQGAGNRRQPLVGAEDAQIIDRRSAWENEDACIQRAKERGIGVKCSVLEVDPKVICLDPPGSNGCGSNPGDGTVIIVGSAASGDFKSDPQGMGGTNDYGGGDDAGGQGGI